MRKILIVDDEYLVRIGIRSFLNWEECGYTIVGEAADGQTALDKIAEYRPDVVLTDLKMDGMDGFELIRISKERWPETLFVVLSGYDDGPNVKRAMKLGASDYIFKLTSRPDELIKILDELPYGQSLERIESVVLKNLSGIKEELIRKAAQCYYPGREALQKDLTQLGIQTDFSRPYAVMLLGFDPQADATNGQPLVKYALENMAQELVAGRLQGEVYPYTGSTLLAVLPVQEAEDALTERVAPVFVQLQEYALQYLGISLHGILSECICGMEALGEAVAVCQRGLGVAMPRQSALRTTARRLRPEIDRICCEVEADLSAEYTVHTAALSCHMSESYFSHLFKKEVGMSFVEYLNQKKIQRAAQLLEQTDLRIGEIAQQVGMCNQNYFSVLFRKYKGTSPVEYRTARKKAEK